MSLRHKVNINLSKVIITEEPLHAVSARLRYETQQEHEELVK